MSPLFFIRYFTIIIIITIIVPFCKLDYLYEARYTDVPLDHFSFTTNETLKLRYLLNGTYHVKGGPIFVYTGNEDDITMFANNSGFMYDIAPLFNALLVFIEHRYYGQSKPSTEDGRKYLSSSQALADFVFVIDELRGMYLSTMSSVDTYPFFAFGGSYGGMLAAWLRMKYPNSVLGAVASSAPIWQFEGLAPCGKFYQIVTKAFDARTNCVKYIKQFWEAIRNISKNAEGRKRVAQVWKLCQVPDKADIIVDWISEIYVDLAMTNYPYPTVFMKPLPAYPLHVFCDKLTSFNATNEDILLEAMGAALQVYTNYSGQAHCIDFLQKDDDTWDFQACSELVMPMCSTENDMFETVDWKFQEYSNECFKKFGVRPKRPDLPVLEYGGRNLKYASNIVFSNGMLDPWASGGVTENISSTVVAIIIEDGVHHSDMRGAAKTDSESLKKARKFIVDIIKSWLNM